MSLLSGLLLLAAGVPEPEARWWFLFSDEGNAWFGDSLTATRSGDIADLTYQQVYREPRRGVIRQRIRSQIDCAGQRLRNVAIDAYDITGKMVGSAQPADPQWSYFLPASDAKALQLYACKGIENWRTMGAAAAYREPLAITLDLYSLMRLGLQSSDAIALARFDNKTQLSEIRSLIESRTRGDLRTRLLRLYGLSASPEA